MSLNTILWNSRLLIGDNGLEQINRERRPCRNSYLRNNGNGLEQINFSVRFVQSLSRHIFLLEKLCLLQQLHWFYRLCFIVKYEEFRRLFLEQYWDARMQAEIRNRIMNRSYNPRKDGSTCEHFMKMAQVAKFLDPPIGPPELISLLAGHFPINIITIIVSRPSLLKETMKLLKVLQGNKCLPVMGGRREMKYFQQTNRHVGSQRLWRQKRFRQSKGGRGVWASRPHCLVGKIWTQRLRLGSPDRKPWLCPVQMAGPSSDSEEL